MPTVVNTLFPPVINSFMPAFVNTTDAVVYFSISPFNSSSDIQHVHISVTNQLNNENALANASGILFSDLKYDTKKGLYYVTIPIAKMAGQKFNINQYYKVQLRFDACNWNNIDGADVPGYDSDAGPVVEEKKVNNYLLSYQQYFSEWSSVCLIRPILRPIIRIKTFEQYTGTGKQTFNKGIIPIVGSMYFGDNSHVETETMQSYQINVLDAENNILLASPTIYTGDNVDPNDINYKIDLQKITIDAANELILEVIGTTKNQYKVTKTYEFQLEEYIDDDANFKPEFDIQMDNENGIAHLHITNASEKNLFGTIYIKRSSSLDQFKSIENIYAAKIAGDLNIKIDDNTVSSLVWYKYYAQFENSAGGFTPVQSSQVFLPDFYDAIISRGDKQYNIKYNYSVSNLKPVVNRAKIDTLGGRYPKFAENAILNYKQFSIQGLISAESDVHQKFLKKKNVYSGNMESFYANYKKNQGLKELVRNDVPDWQKNSVNQYPQTPMLGTVESNYLTTTQNDWMWEREFREELLKWLNDGEPKLYRSMAEGSMVVMLTDVNLTPAANTARFIWNFTATVYEIAEADSLESLDALGIYEIIKLPDESLEEVGPEPEYAEVVKVGQLYQYQVVGKNDIRNMILQNIQAMYGKKPGEEDVWDSSNVLADRKPDDLYLKNVKIFFHNKPNLYWVDSDGRPQWVLNNNYNPSAIGNKHISLGYSFDVITSADNKNTTIFVNDRGYYQIPNELDVKSLSFNKPGDIVTVEYTLVYKEKNNQSNIISGQSISRTIVGQEEGTFQPNDFLGDKIRKKYNFIQADEFSEHMNYWKGICIDATPFSMCGIQYLDDEKEQVYEIGFTGVLHMLKDAKVKDIRFLGRRMTMCDISRQPFLEDWEYVIDNSVEEEALFNPQNWFFINEIDTNKQVSVYLDKYKESLLPAEWSTIESYREFSEKLNKPKHNTVYAINHQLKIYYHDHWYDFKFVANDPTELIENKADNLIGLAIAPIDGQINYWGSVVRSSFG